MTRLRDIGAQRSHSQKGLRHAGSSRVLAQLSQRGRKRPLDPGADYLSRFAVRTNGKDADLDVSGDAYHIAEPHGRHQGMRNVLEDLFAFAVFAYRQAHQDK
jgi:hypothetical protein